LAWVGEAFRFDLGPWLFGVRRGRRRWVAIGGAVGVELAAQVGVLVTKVRVFSLELGQIFRLRRHWTAIGTLASGRKVGSLAELTTGVFELRSEDLDRFFELQVSKVNLCSWTKTTYSFQVRLALLSVTPLSLGISRPVVAVLETAAVAAHATKRGVGAVHTV